MGLPVDATPGKITARYHALARDWHPDALPRDATDADRARARRRFAALAAESDARRKGLPPLEDHDEVPLDPPTEAEQMRALGGMVLFKLATIFVPVAGLAAYVVLR